MRAGRHGNSGFTLAEILVSLAVMGLVAGYVTFMLGRQSQTYHAVDQVTEAQQSLRGIANLLEHEVRMTGYLVSESAAVCAQDNTNTSDVLYVTDSDSLNAGTKTLKARVQAGFTGTATDTLTLDSLILDGTAFYDTDDNGVADSDFQLGGGVIIYDANDSGRGASCGVIESVLPPNQLRVSFTRGGESIGGGGSLYAVPAHVYYVDAGNQLIRDGMVLSSSVEDLQLAFFYDIDEDAEVDSNQEDPGAAAFVGTYQSDDFDNEDLREVRVSVVARSRTQDPEYAAGRFQPAENRTAPAGLTDGYRRRTFTASIQPRNVGQRGGI